MATLLLGRDGQVGWELQRALAPLGPVVAVGRAEADLWDPESVRRLVRSVRPRIIVNAAAYTAVDNAESAEDTAWLVNCASVKVMAEEAKLSAACLIHYSTDYVFDGSKNAPYIETDAPNPINAYGRTKLAGEEAIRQSGCIHLIFRTSWVFARNGSNFPMTMLRLAREKDQLRVVSDQVGAPTSAELIADVTGLCLFGRKSDPAAFADVSGTYNLVAAGEASWHQYARYVIVEAMRNGASLRLAADDVLPIASSDYATPARRPLNSRLAIGKIQDTFGLDLPDWRLHVARFVKERA
ncbi:dTDP-4-dehydrorhamnose reductase [Mesorhizobium sp. CN2-181]|uniref:dTDP-4-dehydrorhamnose reductase n=1 Tax=Mesorhizobium yinganensis TaxID=3157707 RepID=UPI0032B84FFE